MITRPTLMAHLLVGTRHLVLTRSKSPRRGAGAPGTKVRLGADVAQLADTLDRRHDGMAALEEQRWCAGVTDTAWRAGRDQVARRQRDDRRDVLHERHRVEHELVGVGALAHVAVDRARDREV